MVEAEAEKAEKNKSADELFKDFKEASVTEFFRKNKAHLGYSGKVRSLTTVIHELVTNSLDACEEAGILPEIMVEIKQLGEDHYRFREEDNGPGIPAKHIEDVFGKMLAGTKFHRNIQLRGQQGIGVTGVTLFAQMTTGQPMNIKTCTGNHKIHEIKLLLDVSKNKADVLDSKMYEAAWRGTEITGEIKGVQFNLSQQGPYEYIRRTAVANPHLKITLIDPEGRKTVFERASNKIPKQPKEVHPHPKGMDTDELLNLAKRSAGRYVGSFLMSDLSRVSAAKVDEIQKLVNFDLKKNPRKLSWPEAEQIIKAFEKTDFMAPPSEGLSPIGEDQIRKAILNVLKPEFEAIVARNPTTHSGGIPFQVEVAIAYGGNSGRPMEEGVKAEVMRFANRSPLLFDAGGCAITEAVNSVDWKRYGLRDFENSPITVFVNVVSTYIPYTSAGKQSISAEDEVIKEIRMAIMDVGRKFQMYHSRKRRDIEREARLNTLLKYSTELALAVSKITGTDEKKLLDKLDKLVRKKVKLMEAMENVEDEGSEENASVENGVSEEAEENA